MLVLGIMNGTSVDGIDYVWANISGKGQRIKAQFVKQEHKAFSPQIRAQIQDAIADKLTTYDLGLLHHNLGREYAKHFSQLKSPGKTQLIGLHGQTIFHKGKVATWQAGEPSYLAHASKAPVIFNFRAADVALGGEGAPFAPLFHRILLQEMSAKTPVAFHNLGGISNLTFSYKNTLLAFDTGPASTLMDTWLEAKTSGKKTYDEGGQLAAKGLPQYASLKNFLSHPYFKKSPPKSCGREEFNLNFIKTTADRKFSSLSLEDQMSTLTELTASSIQRAYEALPTMPEKIFFSGGGTHNKHLMKRLKIYFKATQVLTSEDLGWPSSAIEGGAFAVLAYKRSIKEKSDLKSVTGGGSALLGQICEL